MALLKVDLCPEVLTDELLDRLWNHFKIKTTVDFLDTDKDLISAELSIDPKIVSTIRQTIFDKHSLRAVNLGDVTTSGHLQERLPIPSLLTDLDFMRSGNKGFFETGRVYEIFGPAGVGKTQLSLYLTTAVALSDDGNVIYVDTKNDFCAKRLSEMIAANLQSRSTADDAGLRRLLDRALDSVRVCKVDQLLTLTNVLFNIANTEDPFTERCRLLVIDNISSLILPLVRDTQIPAVSASVDNVVKVLRRISVDKKLAVVVINGVTSTSSDNAADSSERSYRPALGKIFSSACHSRLMLEKISADDATNPSHVCRLTVLKSDVVISGFSSKLMLTERGFESAKKDSK